VRKATLDLPRGVPGEVPAECPSPDAGAGRRPADWRPHAWNMDHAWFWADEVAGWLPERLEVGQSRRVPERLVARLARFHLVDNVRGQTPPFQAEHVQDAWLEVTVTDVQGDRVSGGVAGAVRVVATGRWQVDDGPAAERTRGFDGRFLGRAEYDRGAGRFTAFELVAAGARHGATHYNGRADDPGPAPMGVVMVLAPDAPADRVAPAHPWGYR
jgi:hypothetical protein